MTYQRNIYLQFRPTVATEHRVATFERRYIRLKNGIDEGLPDRVEQTQVAAGEDREPERDGRALADLAPVGPLHALELVDAVPEEGQQPAAVPARAPAAHGLALGMTRAGRGNQIALDLVGRGASL